MAGTARQDRLTELVHELLDLTGHDIKKVKDILIKTNTIVVTEYAEDEDGNRYADLQANKAAENSYSHRWNDELFWRGGN